MGLCQVLYYMFFTKDYLVLSEVKVWQEGKRFTVVVDFFKVGLSYSMY